MAVTLTATTVDRVSVKETFVSSASNLFGEMLELGGLPTHYKGDVWHDAVKIQDLWRKAHEAKRHGAPICLQFYWGVRDCGTQIGESFDAISIPLESGMRFYCAFQITLRCHRHPDTFHLEFYRLGIPTIDRE